MENQGQFCLEINRAITSTLGRDPEAVQGISRRQVLTYGAACLPLSGCVTAPVYPTEPISGRAVDVHCHLFNGSDLPVVRFLTEVVLKEHGPGGCTLPATVRKLRSANEIEDPTIEEQLIELFLKPLVSHAPTADAELKMLRVAKSLSVSKDRIRVETLLSGRVRKVLRADARRTQAVRGSRVHDRLMAQLRAEAGLGERKARSATDLTTAARRLLSGDGRIAVTLRWIGLFLRSRASLADELADATKANGRDALLLVPLLVDYAHWLGQTTSDGSSLREQMIVMGAVGQRARRVPVHGMMAYDPLRAVFWKRGRHDRFTTEEFDPLALARDAFTSHGFLGLKVYPPMGFKATGNTDDQGYPLAVTAALPGGILGLGQDLNEAMERAFDLCLEFDAPIISHANNSVARGPNYGSRAEPRFWIAAFEKRPLLRLCLAHQGRFCWRESDLPVGSPASRTSWEWTIGRYVAQNPQSHLYMDISYLSEVLGSGPERRYYGDRLKDWVRECDRECRHIVYGTDWVMLGREPGFEVYGKTVVKFLRDDCRFDDAQLDRIMAGNALRFLGLSEGPTRRRILQRYPETPGWATVRSN